MGLSSSLGDVFFVANNRINGNITYPTFTTGSVGESAQTVTFRLQRTGNTLTEQYNTGAGFVSVQSKTDSYLNTPTTIDIFLSQEYGGTAAQQGTFQHLSIKAQGVVAPAPSALLTALMGIVPGMMLLRLRRK